MKSQLLIMVLFGACTTSVEHRLSDDFCDTSDADTNLDVDSDTDTDEVVYVEVPAPPTFDYICDLGLGNEADPETTSCQSVGWYEYWLFSQDPEAEIAEQAALMQPWLADQRQMVELFQEESPDHICMGLLVYESPSSGVGLYAERAVCD